ncbi:MAG: hypothetical protein ACR2MG_17490 [Pyrinomonadaceae bacterium]
MQEEKFITGIHNYCDRWCERCTFTARCRVFSMEQEDTDEERDINNEAFWRNLAGIFAQAKTVIREKAEEFGIDVDAVSDEEFAEIKRRREENLSREDLPKLAEKYGRESRKILEEKDEWLIFSALNEETQNEMLSIIYWYQYFIGAKIHRGLSGIFDSDGNFDAEELEDAQSDANGSIKIALIAVERSLMAWTVLLTNENARTIEPLLNLLETIKRKAEEKFPNARDFIRPGFDEIETVM